MFAAVVTSIITVVSGICLCFLCFWKSRGVGWVEMAPGVGCLGFSAQLCILVIIRPCGGHCSMNLSFPAVHQGTRRAKCRCGCGKGCVRVQTVAAPGCLGLEPASRALQPERGDGRSKGQSGQDAQAAVLSELGLHS